MLRGVSDSPHERVAVITDIHANLPALQAALARIDELGIEAVYCGGDLVGYGPHPNEVCALIQERAIPTIYGNYDHAIARDEHDCGCAYVTAARPRARAALGRMDARPHRRPAKDFMRGLPFDLRFSLGGQRVRLVHGSPRKVNEYLFEDKPQRTFERIAALRRLRRAGLRPHPQALDPSLRRRAVRQLRLGRQAEGRRSACGIRAARGRPAGQKSSRRSSASPTTPRRWPARSRRPGCLPSTPRSSSASGMRWIARSHSGAAPRREAIAAFALVFAGCGAIVADARYDGALGSVGSRDRLRADHHGDGLCDRASVGRAHQPGGHDRVHAHASLSAARRARLRGRPGRGCDGRRARAAGGLDRQAGPSRRDAPERRAPAARSSTRSC